MPPCGQACASRAVRRREEWGMGAACVPPPPGAWPGDPKGRGVALPRSVPLPLLSVHQSGCHGRPSVHGGCGLHNAPVRVRVLTPGVVCGAPLCAGAGPPARRGVCWSRRVASWGRVAYELSGVPPPGAAALLRGGGHLPWPWAGRRVGVPLARLQNPAGWRRWVGGERGGGQAVVPRHLLLI